MKALAKTILKMLDGGRRVSFTDAVKATGAGKPFVRVAFQELHDAGVAKILRAGKGRRGTLYLVSADDAAKICANKNCGREFNPPHYGSKRVTCSRKCHAAIGWNDPESAARRRAAISQAHLTPKAKARLAAHNKRRWSDPVQHQMVSEKNSERARIRREDPEAFERYRAMMRIIQNSPTKKRLYSELRKQWWADPVMRKKMTDAVNASQAVQNYRKNFGEHNRRRWQDPELRAKYTAANSARNTPELKAAASERMKKRWADPAFRKKMAKVGKSKIVRAKARQTRKDRGWFKRDREERVSP